MQIHKYKDANTQIQDILDWIRFLPPPQPILNQKITEYTKPQIHKYKDANTQIQNILDWIEHTNTGYIRLD